MEEAVGIGWQTMCGSLKPSLRMVIMRQEVRVTRSDSYPLAYWPGEQAEGRGGGACVCVHLGGWVGGWGRRLLGG